MRSPYFLAESELGVNIPYFGSQEVASASEGGFGGAFYISIFKINSGSESICKKHGNIRAVDYSDYDLFFDRFVGRSPADIGMGVGKGRVVYLKNGDEEFEIICDGDYILWRHGVM